jgi:hypothetical protein
MQEKLAALPPKQKGDYYQLGEEDEQANIQEYFEKVKKKKNFFKSLNFFFLQIEKRTSCERDRKKNKNN